MKLTEISNRMLKAVKRACWVAARSSSGSVIVERNAHE